MGTQPQLTARLCTALALIALLAGCGETDDQRAARATVSQFYEALKRHDAAGACRLVAAAERKACVTSVRQVFRRVAASPDPNYFDKLPDVGAARIEGDRATVVVRRDILRRHVTLSRARDGWRITGSPESSG